MNIGLIMVGLEINVPGRIKKQVSSMQNKQM